MIITKKKDYDALTISLKGRLDSLTAPELEREMKNSLYGISELTFDLAGLEYVSSAGLRIFLSSYKKTGNLKIINANKMVTDVLNMTGLDTLFDIR